MSTYKYVLPSVFSYMLIVPRHEAAKLVEVLMLRDDLKNGSSFAVTVDFSVSHGSINIWLSETSFRYLDGLRLIKETYANGVH